MEISLREILRRIPGLEGLYRQTFGEEALTELSLETGSMDNDFRIRVDDQDLFAGRDCLKLMVSRWRERFPFLRIWRRGLDKPRLKVKGQALLPALAELLLGNTGD